jgi:hypothetical protein
VGNNYLSLQPFPIVTLAALLVAAGKLEPRPVLWRVMQTSEVFVDRAEASEAARAASGYVSPFDFTAE